MIHVTAAMPDGVCRTDLDPASISDLIAQKDVIVWVDLNQPGAADFDVLREEFGFHPLAIEDVVKGHQRPKIDVYDGYYFLVLYAVSTLPGAAAVRAHELEIFIGPNYVVTVHDDDIREVTATLEQWRRNIQSMGLDIGALVYTLADRVVDDYFPVIDQIAERIEEIEEHIFDDFDPVALHDIFELKKQLLMIRRLIAPQRDVFNVLLRRDPPILPPQSMPYFQDVYDHIIRVTESLDTYRELLTGALDAFLSVQGNRLSEVMYRLAIISTIFLPLTFLTGFFGMNFEDIPFASGWLLLLGLMLMVVTPLALLWLVRIRGWVWRPIGAKGRE